MTQWGVLWAHTSTADDLQLVDGCFTSITDATAYAGPVARTGGFAYRLVRRRSPAAPWLTPGRGPGGGLTPLEALRRFAATGRWS